jgi:hypothetical protein
LDGPEDAVPAEAMPWLAALWDLLEGHCRFGLLWTTVRTLLD